MWFLHIGIECLSSWQNQYLCFGKLECLLLRKPKQAVCIKVSKVSVINFL